MPGNSVSCGWAEVGAGGACKGSDSARAGAPGRLGGEPSTHHGHDRIPLDGYPQALELVVQVVRPYLRRAQGISVRVSHSRCATSGAAGTDLSYPVGHGVWGLDAMVDGVLLGWKDGPRVRCQMKWIACLESSKGCRAACPWPPLEWDVWSIDRSPPSPPRPPTAAPPIRPGINSDVAFKPRP